MLTDGEFRRIGAFIESEFGIQMPSSKKSLIQSRLLKRLQACSMRSYGDYFDFVTKDPSGSDEYLRFADLISTHETSFFREPRHFEHLRAALPALAKRVGRRPLRLLSAACSSGEEAYSLAVTADSAFRGSGDESMPFSVEGFDLSHHCVEAARRAVYPGSRLRNFPERLKPRYLMRRLRRDRDECRVVPELRARATFHSGNLLEDMGLSDDRYDVIFCRNVLIYFGRRNQARAIERLMARLEPDGYLYLGHSESMSSLGLPLRADAHSVYRRA